MRLNPASAVNSPYPMVAKALLEESMSRKSRGRAKKGWGPTSGDRVLHVARALPESDDVSFGVFEVSCEAHVRYWLFLLNGFAA